MWSWKQSPASGCELSEHITWENVTFCNRETLRLICQGPNLNSVKHGTGASARLHVFETSQCFFSHPEGFDLPSVWGSDTAWISLERRYPQPLGLRPVKVGHKGLFSHQGYKHMLPVGQSSKPRYNISFNRHYSVRLCACSAAVHRHAHM